MADDHCEVKLVDPERVRAVQASLPPDDTVAELAAVFGLLSDPSRLRLLSSLLEGGELCVCDLAWIVERADNLVSHHVRQLRSAGLVSSRREGKMVLYAVTDRGRTLLETVLGRAVVG